MTKTILVIMDGLGLAKPSKGNAVFLAKTPNLDFLMKKYNYAKIKASGESVGLPKGSQGNSEVGHLHMGAGRIVWQPFERINRSIKSGEFFKNKQLLNAVNFAVRKKSSLHLMGLCSDEGVHATTKHLFALMKLAKKRKIKNVFIHCFLDGRDVPEKSAEKYIKQIELKCKQLGIGKIASLTGRYYSMDRDNNWNRTKKAYDLLVKGKGFEFTSALNALKTAYKRGDSTDYYVQPSVITKNKKPIAIIKENDSVIFFNFRTDRTRQLSHAFCDKEFSKFKRGKKLKIKFTGMTLYDKKIKMNYAFTEPIIKNNLGSILAKNKKNQLRIAETEKYAHVTYFFNSQVEKPYKGEKRILIPSLKVKSYDLKPEMSAKKITKTAIVEIKKNKYDFILINFANCDLVGHAGKLKAEIKAVETVDKAIGQIVKIGKKENYAIILTADHGSAEEMLYPGTNIVCPSHSKNKVPLIIVSNKLKVKKTGGLIDVAPTVLDLLKINKPKEMEGNSLARK